MLRIQILCLNLIYILIMNNLYFRDYNFNCSTFNIFLDFNLNLDTFVW